jgi:hypothetical protein
MGSLLHFTLLNAYIVILPAKLIVNHECSYMATTGAEYKKHACGIQHAISNQ